MRIWGRYEYHYGILILYHFSSRGQQGNISSFLNLKACPRSFITYNRRIWFNILSSNSPIHELNNLYIQQYALCYYLDPFFQPESFNDKPQTFRLRIWCKISLNYSDRTWAYKSFPNSGIFQYATECELIYFRKKFFT